MAKDDKYDADSIQVLEGLAAVRKRPSMYIGSTDARGLHHLVYEVVDNAIDEAMVGYCDNIKVILNKEGSVTVIDNGRGIPVDIHPKYKCPGVEIIMTRLHAGGKFDKKSYKVSGGLHGVGVSVVNALSEWLEVSVSRQGKVHSQRYERGVPTGDVTVAGASEDTGTTIVFKPDSQIFEDTEFDFDTLSGRLREIAFLNNGLDRQDDAVRPLLNGNSQFKPLTGLVLPIKEVNPIRVGLVERNLVWETEVESKCTSLRVHVVCQIQHLQAINERIQYRGGLCG